MALRDYTKRLFANTLAEMMRTTPLEKVRVKTLCARCGAERQSFYYHFRDKYDLVAWIFMQDYFAALEGTGGKYIEEHAVAALREIEKKQAFYKNAFSDNSQNAIQQYLFDYFVTLGTDVVKQHYALETLDMETVYAIKSHSFACVGHTKEWLEGKSGYTPEQFAHLQYKFMPEVLKLAYGIRTSKIEGGASAHVKNPGSKYFF